MRSDRRRLIATIGLTVSGALLARGLMRPAPSRTSWPDEKAIKLVVPFAPGGPTDLIGRLVAQSLRDAVGARVYVENRPGAGGNIAFAQVAQAAADGYTLLVCTNALALNPWLYHSIAYDPVEDFEPIVEMVAAPNVFFASRMSGIGSIADLVRAARRHPDQLNYASPGVGTPPFLAAELLKVREKIEVAHVVFGGSSPASQAVMAGDVQAGCVALPGAHMHIHEGKLTGLALTGETRWLDLPAMPTMRELGYDGFVPDTAYQLMAPAGLPPRVTATIAGMITRDLREAGNEARLRKYGFQVLARGPTDLKARIAREIPVWQGIVAEARLKMRS